ncbi:hypothetical protein OCL06_15945 [Alteromonas sp. ASW11-19]|uniref:Uncharacterized protein n=1 Tax=Alteromonas salexigens TaxID=2982530 RepID=A0ABT2VRY3_9ALTE|nr:hypothetical protein [Alteromonas salexigens]MCU7556084.1 hypothetical protein [Alteromonas salexigens]
MRKSKKDYDNRYNTIWAGYKHTELFKTLIAVVLLSLGVWFTYNALKVALKGLRRFAANLSNSVRNTKKRLGSDKSHAKRATELVHWTELRDKEVISEEIFQEHRTRLLK